MIMNTKCNYCPLKDNCQYYQITGENFQYYPGIFFKVDQFKKNIYQYNEECEFEILFIGKMSAYHQYLEIFFKEYLDYQLFSYPFQIKSYRMNELKQEMKYVDVLKVKSVIEDTNFVCCYNQMVNYYKTNYNCSTPCLKSNVIIDNKRNIKDQMINFSTKKIYPKGYVYEVKLQQNISCLFFETGIGIFNYIGGGMIENKN